MLLPLKFAVRRCPLAATLPLLAWHGCAIADQLPTHADDKKPICATERACQLDVSPQDSRMSQRNCPKCGHEQGPQLASTRTTNCPACGTSLFLLDDRFELAGDQGVMHDAPMLMSLGDRVTLLGTNWRLIGQARFSYGRGSWDEFWAEGDGGAMAWVSVDEGEVVVQTELRQGERPNLATVPVLGDSLSCNGTRYRVTELESATCQAFRGTLPEVMALGEIYRFANCTGEDGSLLSGEFWLGQSAWFRGRWVDPFDIARQVAK
jgi:ribosomal protein S27E